MEHNNTFGGAGHSGETTLMTKCLPDTLRFFLPKDWAWAGDSQTK